MSNPLSDYRLSHLQQLEAESIHILREVAAEFQNPVLMYSIGKDSTVMLRLAQKAFFPSPLPFPLLHVDTRWEFQEMGQFRDRLAEELELDMRVWINPEGIEYNINPIDHGSEKHTHVMKTEALKQALDHYRFDAALGGARRDEEKSRAKERVYSVRNKFHQWDPKSQRPELWQLYNGRLNQGECMRIFPLSNWTELDIWLYILKEKIPIVSLYLAETRPVVFRSGTWIMLDDDRMPLEPGEIQERRRVRFRTLGCYPLTGGIESDADSVEKIVQEMILAKTSERQGRLIDFDSNASMEEKKKDGYF